jgi:hypothetical protein
MGKKSEQEKDVRLAATKQIWGWTTAILTISTPLAISLRNPIIPLAALAGASIGTVAVWGSDNKKSKGSYLAPQQVELLEQRIRDLETIVSSEDYDLKIRLKQLESSNFSKNNHDKFRNK